VVPPDDPPVAPVEPLLSPVEVPPLATVVPPVVPPSAGLVVASPAAGSAVFDAVVVVPVGAGLVAAPLATPVLLDDAGAFDALPEPLVTTGLGLATGVRLVVPPDVVPPELADPPTGSVTRFVAPPLEVEVFVGAAARFVPTVLAVTGRRTPEVLGASGLAGGAEAPAAGAPAEPFASMPAASSPASGVAGTLGTTGGGAT